MEVLWLILKKLGETVTITTYEWDITMHDYIRTTEEVPAYKLYIQGNRKIVVNADSSGLFDWFINLRTIEGLEYLDTSNVINMSYMFNGCGSLLELILIHRMLQICLICFVSVVV